MAADRPPLLLPVKGLGSAKARLAPVLSREERAALVLAMLADVLDSVRAAELAAWVLSPDPVVLAFAKEQGAVPLLQGSGAPSLAQALEKHLPDRGDAMVVLPDTPLVSPEELGELVVVGTSAGSPAVVLAPDRSGQGTNALFLHPAGAIPLRFGPESALLHQAEGAALGVPVQVLRLPGLALDLDTPADLVALLRERPSEHLGRRTRLLMAHLRLKERLAAFRSWRWPAPGPRGGSSAAAG